MLGNALRWCCQHSQSLELGVPPSLLRTGGGVSTPNRTEQRKPFNTLTRCQSNSLNIAFDLFPSCFCGKCTFQKLALLLLLFHQARADRHDTQFQRRREESGVELLPRLHSGSLFFFSNRVFWLGGPLLATQGSAQRREHLLSLVPKLLHGLGPAVLA